MLEPLPLPAHRLLDEVEALLAAGSEEVRARYGSWSGEHLVARPRPGVWSVADCLSHLTNTSRAYRGRIEPALAGGAPRDGGRPVRGSVFGRWFTRRLSPGTAPLRAPRIFRPDQGNGGEEAVGHFLAEQARLLALVGRARGLDLDRIRLSSPVTSLIRLRLGDALRVLAVHTRRHLDQAARVAEAPPR